MACSMIDILNGFFKHNTINDYLLFVSPFVIYWFIYDIKNAESNKTITFLSFILNSFWIMAATKGILQVPLQDHPNTFAMPSGHVFMKMSVILSMMQALLPKHKLIVYSISIIAGSLEGLRVIYYGYHTIPDVLVAILICLIQSLLFYEILYKRKLDNLSMIVGIVMNPALILIMKFYAPKYMIRGLYKVSFVATIAYIALFIGRKIFKKINH